MATRTESALRFPAWLVAILVAAGVALGLSQVGVFDPSTNGERGAGAHAAASHSRNPSRTSSADVTAGEIASPINRIDGRKAQRPMQAIDQLAGEPDPEVREESDALQDALAAEQASN